jgi:hypothetical protein
MKSRIARVLLLLFLVIVLAGAWYKPLDSVATAQIDAGFSRALVIFATARTLNAIISTIQSAELAFQPFGIGTTFAPGQMLHPINEFIAQFAELMLAASIAFAVMRALIGIGSFWAISLLMSALAVIWGLYRWRGQQSPIWIERMLFVFLLVRFAMPLVTVGSDAVFQRFMQDDYTKSQKAIEGNREELMTLVPTIDDTSTAKSVTEQIKAWWSNVHFAEWLKKVWQTVSRLPEHLIRIIVVFLMQTLVVPLLLFWALYKGSKAMILSPSHLLQQLDKLPKGVIGGASL